MPAALTPASPNRADGNVRLTWWATALALALGLGITAAAALWLHESRRLSASARFEQQVERIEADAQHYLNLPFTGLKAGAGVYAASVDVTSAEFRAFVESSNVRLEYSGIRGFGFVELVKSRDVEAFVAARRRDGNPDFAVKTRGAGSELYIVKFLEPSGSNQAALGLNLASDPVRKRAIEQAIASGQPTLSGPVQLVQDDRSRPGFVFLLPIYRQGSKPATVPERQASLVGILLAPVVLEEIMAQITAALNGQMRVSVYDSQEAVAAPANLLFEGGSSPGPAKNAKPGLANAAPMFETSRLVVVGGRHLTLRMGSTAAFEAQQGKWSAWLEGLLGAMLSGLLALAIWLLGSGRARALALAQQMTANLAQERQRLHNIVEGTHVATWVWQVSSGALQLDERWAAMMGYDFATLGPQNMSDWRNRIHPDEAPAIQAALQQHFRGETRYFEYEHRIRHRDGHWVWVLDRGKVSSWTPEGRPLMMSGTQMDITDKQAIQQALHTSEENFRQLFDSSLHGILQAQPNGAVQYANPAACQLFGLTQDEIRVRGRAGLVALDDSRFHILMAQARMLGHARGGLTLVRGNGSRFEGELSLTSYRSPGGKLCNNLFLHDVTRQKQAEAQISALNAALEGKVRQRTAQLEEANQELEAFSYSVAHDLRSPLRSIDGFSHLLEKAVAADLSERSRHYLRRIRAGVKQMDELTDGLLSLAHLSRTPLRAEPVDMSALAARALQACREHEHDAGRQVDTLVEPGLLASGDPALLYQVMENLLANAWKFTARTADARIQVGQLENSKNGEDDDRSAPACTTYFVRDNGAGFDMAYVEKLFGTFQRLHSPGEFAGTGLGLATTQRIILRHAGRIWAEGAVGQGATFFFSLPGAAPACG